MHFRALVAGRIEVKKASPHTDEPADPAVVEYVDAMMREAELQADLVGTFLIRAGYKPARTKQPLTTVPMSPQIQAFLLELGAALRLRQWENSGILENLDLATASGDETLVAAANRLLNAEPATHPAAIEVFKASLLRLAREARPTLNTDIVLPGALLSDDLLDVLAGLLWKNRHLASTKDGEE